VLVLLALAEQTHRGTGTAADLPKRAGLEQVQLSQTAAHGYNPFGTGPESRDQIDNVVDNDPNTTWSTEQYYEGTLKKAGGVGLGIYLDAAPGVVGKAIAIQTPTPGFAVQVYVADRLELSDPYGASKPLMQRGWQGPVGASARVHSGERIPLRLHGARHRYYLMWMIALPPSRQSATIAELTLFR
ncbi:MAG: hypothetical protein H0X28_14400, partial [Solirubrobacterales bacterium]|nr:hypothetical protein [Solirubrobacterales bacterium]